MRIHFPSFVTNSSKIEKKKEKEKDLSPEKQMQSKEKCFDTLHTFSVRMFTLTEHRS